MKKNGNKAILSTGLLAAIASSLCCIAPLIAIFGGVSGAASTFSWIEPARPYLIGVSVLALGLAFYQAYKPKPADDCGCEIPKKKSFLSSKTFLWSITIFSILMFSFPYYSHVFYGQSNATVEVNNESVIECTLRIDGMTCTGCENHVQSALLPLNGVVSANASYENGNAVVQVDTSKVSIGEMKAAIKTETGYTVTNYKLEE